MSETKRFTQADFSQSVLQSERPVLVDFYADWCGPCRFVAPVIEELAQEYEGRIEVGKVDVDDQRELARQYGITSIPTVLLFNGGEVVDAIRGAAPKGAFVKKLDAHLAA